MAVGISDQGNAPPITLTGGRSSFGAGGDVTVTGGSGDAATGGSVTIQAGARGDGTDSAGTASIKSASGNNAVSVTDNQIDINAGTENSKIVMTVPVPTSDGLIAPSYGSGSEILFGFSGTTTDDDTGVADDSYNLRITKSGETD